MEKHRGKRVMSVLLAGALFLGASPAAFAATAGAPAERGAAAAAIATATQPDTSATQPAAVTTNAAVTAGAVTLMPPKQLSLAQAVEIMTTTGTRAETAKLNREADIAIANGYSEKYKTIRDGLDSMSAARNQTVTAQQVMIQNHLEMNMTNMVLAGTIATMTNQTIADTIQAACNSGVTSTNKKIMQERRDFARKYTEDNYRAELNQIERDTINLYDTVLLAEENYRIAQDNLTAQQAILKNVTAKKDVGVLSKKDVLEAKSAVTDAESDVRAAKTQMEYAHMSFNYLLGFAPMQEVVFTDTLTPSADTTTAASIAIESALGNRNEIKGADFAAKIYKLLFDSVNAYPKDSSTRMTADVNCKNAEKTARDARSQIEIDMRNKAAIVEDKKADLDAAVALRDYAEEGLRLMKLTYEEGLSTPDALLAMQVKAYQANLNVASATAAYNLAMREYGDAQGVGTMRIPL